MAAGSVSSSASPKSTVKAAGEIVKLIVKLLLEKDDCVYIRKASFESCYLALVPACLRYKTGSYKALYNAVKEVLPLSESTEHHIGNVGFKEIDDINHWRDFIAHVQDVQNKLISISEEPVCLSLNLSSSSTVERLEGINTGTKELDLVSAALSGTSSSIFLSPPLHTAMMYPCSHCSREFECASQLAQHAHMHTGEKPYQCSTCGARFGSRSYLRTHTYSHTGERPFQCSLCDKAFVTSSRLADHGLTHSGIKPYECAECNACFATPFTLRVHLRSHTGEKPFQCPICGERLGHKSGMAAHVRTHTGEKPYKCSFCDQTFNRSDGLRSHVRVHTGEKPYSCSICGETFRQGSTLRNHSRIHTGEKPFHCSFCGLAFSLRGNMRQHERALHGVPGEARRRSRGSIMVPDSGEKPAEAAASEAVDDLCQNTNIRRVRGRTGPEVDPCVSSSGVSFASFIDPSVPQLAPPPLVTSVQAFADQ